MKLSLVGTWATLLAFVCAAAPAAAQAGGGKLAYVNTQAILKSTPGYAQAESTFTKELETYRGEVQKLQASLDSSASDFEQQSVMLSPTQRAAKRKGNLEGQQQKLEQRTQELQQRAASRERELLDPIQTKVNSVIEGIRASGNYAMIFDVSAPNSGIVTADKSLDLTDKVIQQLKSGSEAVTSAGLTAQAVADLVGGRLLGDGTVVLRAIRALDSAGPEAISLAVSPKYAEELRVCRAGAVLVPAGLADAPGGPRTRIVVPDPYAAMVRVMGALFPPAVAGPGVDATARLGAGVALGRDVSIGPFVVLGRGVRLGDRCALAEGVSLGDGVTVGEDTVIGPRAVLYHDTSVGSRVVIKAGAVLGGPGFGYLSDATGHHRIPHVGACIVEDEVEIGSNSCVDRGSVNDTVIGRGTKLDNLVHVGHNVRLGERCLVMAGVGIAGSTRIGNDVILAGHVGVTDHLLIGDGARIAAKSAVFGDVPAGASFSGHPARPHRQFLRAQAALYRLAPIIADLERVAQQANRDG